MLASVCEGSTHPDRQRESSRNCDETRWTCAATIGWWPGERAALAVCSSTQVQWNAHAHAFDDELLACVDPAATRHPPSIQPVVQSVSVSCLTAAFPTCLLLLLFGLAGLVWLG